MKMLIKKRLASMALLLLAAAGALAFDGYGQRSAPQWNMGSSFDPLTVTVEVVGFEAVELNGGHVIRIPGQAKALHSGAPDVPVLARTLESTPGRARLVMRDSESKDFPDVNVLPTEFVEYRLVDDSGPQVEERTRVADPTIYDVDAFWPRDVVELQEAWMGRQRLLRIEVHPVQYNPVSRIVRFYPRIEFDIVFEADAEDVP